MFVCMYVRIYGRMYVHICALINVCTYVRTCVRTYVRTYVYVCIYVCIHRERQSICNHTGFRFQGLESTRLTCKAWRLDNERRNALISARIELVLQSKNIACANNNFLCKFPVASSQSAVKVHALAAQSALQHPPSECHWRTCPVS